MFFTKLSKTMLARKSKVTQSFRFFTERTMPKTLPEFLLNPQFYSALGIIGGVIKYSHSERLRRKEVLIGTARKTLEDLKHVYVHGSDVNFKTELNVANLKAKLENEGKMEEAPVIFTDEVRLEYAKFAELQYRTVLAGDTRLTNSELRQAIDVNFRQFIITTFSPNFKTDDKAQKMSIAYYFRIHQLVIEYERSLSEFIANISRPHVFETSCFLKLHAHQKRRIENVEAICKNEILDKSPQEVLLNLTNIFRRSHFEDDKHTVQNLNRK